MTAFLTANAVFIAVSLTWAFDPKRIAARRSLIRSRQQ